MNDPPILQEVRRGPGTALDRLRRGRSGRRTRDLSRRRHRRVSPVRRAIRGRHNVQALRSQHPDKPSGFVVRRIVGAGDLWVTEYSITYNGRRFDTVSIMEFQAGKVVRETQYFAEPFEPPAWRARLVERMT